MSQNVTISGNLTADPHTIKFSTGTTLTKLRLASSTVRRTDGKDENGKPVWEEVDSLYIDVECWGQLAVNCKRSLRKGFPVTVDGRLVTETWEEKQDGKDPVMRSKIKLKARQISFDLSNFQVSSVRTSNVSHTLEGQEPVQAKGIDDLVEDPDYEVDSRVNTQAAPSFADAEGEGRELVGAASGGDSVPF